MTIRLRFDCRPDMGAQAPQFIEAEDDTGASIKVGEWVADTSPAEVGPNNPDGRTGDWHLVIQSNFDRIKEFHRVFAPAQLKPYPVLREPEIAALRIRLIEDELEELRQAIADGDIVEIADALADLNYVVYGTAAAYGIDADACYAEVHRSNMSKAGPDGKPIVSDGTDGWPAGKVLKGPNYTPPDLVHILESQLKRYYADFVADVDEGIAHA